MGTFGGANEDALSPNIGLAFPLTSGDDSLPNRVTFDQPTVEAMLKDLMKESEGWNSAHTAVFAGLPSGMPLVLGIIAKIAEQLTGLPVSTWVSMWNSNPIVANVNTVATDALAAINTLSANIQTFLGSLDFLDEDFDLEAALDEWIDFIPDFLQSKTVGLVTDLNTATTNAVTALANISTVVTNIVNKLGGDEGSWAAGDEAQALLDAADNISALSARLDAITAGGGGQSVTIDFSTYTNSTNLPSIFTQSYSGSGDNTYGVTSGRVKSSGGTDLARSTKALYNVFVTDTDQQVVAGVWTVRPSNDGLGSLGHCFLRGRENSAGTTCVYVDFRSNSATIGCIVSGTTTVLATKGSGGSGSFSFKAGALYALYIGTSVGTRQFVLKENSTPILTVTDGSSVSQMGASYRGGGLGASWPFNNGNVKPGEMLYWSFGDYT